MRDQDLLFAAGAAAQDRGWSRPAVVSDLDELPALTPSGPAVVVAAWAANLTTDAVQSLAAVYGAGRDVLIVTETAPDESALAWLPERCWHVVNRDDDNSHAEEPVNALSDVLAAIARDPDMSVRSDAARASDSPPELLVALAQDSESYVRQLVAANLATPPTVLEWLAHDESERVRTAVVNNERTPDSVAAELKSNPVASFPSAVARDPECPPEVLLSLAQNPETHGALLENPNTPGEALRLISRGSDRPSSDYRLALHPNTPTDVLRSLTGEPFSWVICKNPAAPLELRLWAFEHGRREEGAMPWDWSWQIDGCEEWPEPLLKELVDLEQWPPPVLWSSPHLSAGFIRYMVEKCRSEGSWAEEYDGDCKRACLQNPTTPPDVIDQLAADPDPLVRLIVGSVMLRRPEFSDERAEALMRSCVRDAVTEEPEDYVWEDSAEVVDDILSDPNCPASVRAEAPGQSSSH